MLKFEGSWHGMHDYSLWGTVPSAPSDYPHAKPDSVGIPAQAGETVLVTPFNDTARAVETIERNAADLAAVIVEPLQRVLLPEPGFLQALREVTKKHGIVLVFDEIVTGFRIAWGGAQERYGVVPDVACYGKAMSGGFPMAAVVGTSDVMSVLDGRKRPRAEVVWATHTLSRNPIGATAGCAALDALAQPGVYDRLHRTGSQLRAGIVAAGERHGFAVQTPGEDAVFGVRFTARKPLRNWMDLTTADKELGLRWALEMIRRGILVNPNEKIYISIVHTDADVDRTLESRRRGVRGDEAVAAGKTAAVGGPGRSPRTARRRSLRVGRSFSSLFFPGPPEQASKGIRGRRSSGSGAGNTTGGWSAYASGRFAGLAGKEIIPPSRPQPEEERP